MAPIGAINLFENRKVQTSAITFAPKSTGGVEGKPFVGEIPQKWGAAAARVQNGELTPNLETSGSSFTNGLGHSEHTLNLMI